MIRTGDSSYGGFHPDGHFVFHNADVSNFVFVFRCTGVSFQEAVDPA